MNFDIRKNSDEAIESELPALELLYKLGYDYKSQLELNKEREDYRQVILYRRLEHAIRKLNPLVDEQGIQEAISQIHEDRFPHYLEIVDTNQIIRSKLVGHSNSSGLEPITVIQNFGDGNFPKTIRLFDFDNSENNDFLVTNQFEIGGFKQEIFPDIVIFVNGIPLVIIECKSPYIADPINQAINNNLAKYQSREGGYERLMFYNHFLVASCGSLARHGTVGSTAKHYARWSEAYPSTLEEIEDLCERKPREQEILISGMLSKSHILDLLKNFVVYEVIDNKKVKKIAKHQQYRVVTKAIERLQTENESVLDKGGVIWHTQGSGKSLSMLWFATQLRNKFGNPPVIVITDRKQLDEQIERTFEDHGFGKVYRANTRNELTNLLKASKGKTVMTTIQKFLGVDDLSVMRYRQKENIGNSDQSSVVTMEKTIVLVDEAHRSQYKHFAHAMRIAIPNGTFFAFTGTPIDKENKNTYKIFGQLLDKYTFEESKADGATVPIYYEGRLPTMYVEGDDTIDQIFERVFGDLDKEEKQKLKRQYITREKISQAPSRIKKIAWDILQHFTTTIQPNGFKAMVVASSREAAVLYKTELDSLNAPISKIVMTTNVVEDRIKYGSGWDKYYLTDKQIEQISESFKSNTDPIQILIVVDMLLVGYDVPIVQVMYLDHPLKEHNLLQAIARVNRPYEQKDYGLIVDYCGITKELRKALAIFEKEDIQGALEPIDKEIEELQLRHKQAMSYFESILDKENNEQILEIFESAHTRDRFEYDYKMLSKALDNLLPRPEAKQFVEDFKYLSKKRFYIRNRYNGTPTSLKEYGRKVQQIIDDHIRAIKVSGLIETTEITHQNFLSIIPKINSEKAKMALVKSRARQIIKEYGPNNPAYYEKLRERLEKIIHEEEHQRRENADYLKQIILIIQEALNIEDEQRKRGLSKFEFSVFEELQRELSIKEDDFESIRKMAVISRKIYEKIYDETKLVGWKSKMSSNQIISENIYDILVSYKLPGNKLDDLISKITEYAKRYL